MSRADGHVEIDPSIMDMANETRFPPFQVMQNSDQTAGQFSLLQESKAEIDLVGPNPSLVGQTSGGASGRAIQAQQQAGLAELAPIYDSLRDWTIRVYRAIWERIKQYWTDERYIRITSDMQAPQWLTVNEVVGFDPFTMQPMVQNRVAEMDVDIIIDEAPDHVTLQAEQFEQLSAMAQAGLPIPPEVLIEASSLRDKPKLLEMMQQAKQEAMMQQQAMAQAQAQSAQAAAQLQQIDVASKADERAATAEQKRTDTALKVAGAMGGAMMPPTAAGF
jgi:D-ribose pyranose/furanose isomerase RbsD